MNIIADVNGISTKKKDLKQLKILIAQQIYSRNIWTANLLYYNNQVSELLKINDCN